MELQHQKLLCWDREAAGPLINNQKASLQQRLWDGIKENRKKVMQNIHRVTINKLIDVWKCINE